MMVPWFNFDLNRPMAYGIAIGLVLAAFLRTVVLHG